jgi:hypothetical protein
MKNLLLLFVLLPFVSLSQIKIDSNLITPINPNDCMALNLNLYYLRELKSESNTNDIDSLYSLKYKNVKNPVTRVHATVTSTNLTFFCEKGGKSCIMKSITTDNETLSIDFFERTNRDMTYTLLVKENGDLGHYVIINQYYKDEKIKTYFTFSGVLKKVTY